MRRLFTLMAVFQIFASSASAQLLWEVTGKGIDRPSYILGTHHAVPFTFCDSIPGLMRIFDKVDCVMGELDMIKMDQMSLAQQQQMQSVMMMPADTTLESLFSEEEQNLLNSYLKEVMGANLQMFSSLKPMTLMVTLQNKILIDVIPDIATMTGMDKYMQTLAVSKGKRVSGLETVEYQLNLLYGNSLQEQASALLEMARKNDSKEVLMELTEAYKSQDLKALLEVFNKQMTEYEYNAFVLVRNRNWVEQIKELLPEQSTIFVVGSGHLLGDDGLITLLKDRGFKVKPVKK